MEFVGGGNLADLEDVTRGETLLLARQTSQALSYLHDQDITHRDIKPENILIVSRGLDFYCKIADFGESSHKKTLTTWRGTLRYQAPEIEKPPYSKAVDIWSLGIVLVECWYDWYPFCLDKLSDTLHNSWLPGTDGPGVPGVNTFQRKKFSTINLTMSRRAKWHEFIHGKLQEERLHHCSMAQILLQMLEINHMSRYSASDCRYHFDKLDLPDESRIRKRNADLADLDADASLRIRDDLTKDHLVPLSSSGGKAPDSGASRHPQARAASLRDIPPPRRSKRLQAKKTF